MVIAIIGMLTALVSVAAVRAIGTAKNAQITTEIGLLDTAMQTYKNETSGAFPPDFTLLSTPGSTPTATNVQNRQNRIMTHFRKAYPRLTFPGGYGASTQQGTLQYAVQQAFANYDGQSTAPPIKYSAYSAMASSVKWGNLDNLDPAEALVFWIGGPPAPPYHDLSTNKWIFSLRGFSANKLNPLELISDSRSTSAFEFQQSRLGDADGDGWPEYYPPIGEIPQPPGSAVAPATPVPPYVYFDAVSYGSFTAPITSYPASASYPSTSGSGLQPTAYAQQWFTAIPYVQTVPTSGTMTWVNPKKYQIISAGLDQMYWFSPTAAQAPLTLRVYPLGTNYSEGDLDNLTNFTSSTLQSAQP